MTTATLPRAGRVLLAPLRWLERSRGWRWRWLVLLYGIVTATLGLLAYRASRLSGLPDVGPPFDMVPVLAIDVPNDRNAWTIWRRAIAQVKRSEVVERRIFNGPWSWPKPTDAEALAYMARNDEALELWRLGADRPDAMIVRPADLTPETMLNPEVQQHRNFWRMALVDASGRTARGDMAGAWRDYRAILRASRLLGRNGYTVLQLVGASECGGALPLIRAWADDPRVDAPLIRAALTDTRAAFDLTASTSDALRIDYLVDDRRVVDTDALLGVFLEDPYEGGATRGAEWLDRVRPLQRVLWFAANEPERTRRLNRLAFANWAAHADDLPASRPGTVGPADRPWAFFDIAADRAAGGVSGRELARRVEASRLASWFLMDGGPHGWADRDRAARSGVILALASALFEREQGRPPELPEELVGPYLDRLPDGYVSPPAATPNP